TNGRDPGKGSIFTGPIEAIYEGPITIDRTTVLRAAAHKAGLGPSNIDTQTYIFTKDVAEQSTMQKAIVDDDVWGPQMDEALTSIPTISIAIDDDEHLVKRGQGQTRFEGTTLNDYESKVSVEWLNGDGSKGFQTDAGVSRFGGYYTDHGKYSYRFQFRKKYGNATLKYPVFRGHENGLAPAEEFDSLNLRSGSHDMQARGAYMSNRFVDDSMLEMGGIAPHGRFVHVYINGSYNGQYHLRERWNAAMHASYFGGSEEDYDAINRNDNFTQDAKAFDGNQDYWKEVEALARGDSPWEALQGHVDLKDYYEFMMVWSSGNSESEMQAVGSKTLGVPFTFYMKDADGWLIRSAHSGGRGRFMINGPGRFNTELRSEKHIDHQMFLADLIHKHFTNGGAMTPEQTIPRLQRRVDEIKTAFIAESARWRKHKPDAWLDFQQDVMDRHFSSLADRMLDMFESIDAYPDNILAPVPNQQGGAIEAGFMLKMSAGTLFKPEKGDFFYTLDGSDPRLPGGKKSEDALLYERQGPGLELTETVTVKARTFRPSLFSNGTWSPLMEATFHIGEKPVPGDLVISEIHYRPVPPSEEEIAAGFESRGSFEFIELYNRSDSMVSLSEVAFVDGVRFVFNGGDVMQLAPGRAAVVVANRDAFEYRYGTDLPVAGEYTGFRLSDGGEDLRLSREDGVILQELEYNDKEPWPTVADGE
ncbi:MAG: CotH kinase family protein, partial [Verrucomicrobiota bacterium]